MGDCDAEVEAFCSSFLDLLRYLQLHVDSMAVFTEEQRLQLYGYFQLITFGKCESAKPSKVHRKQDLRRWRAWKHAEQFSKLTCMKRYMTLVEGELPDWRGDFAQRSKSMLVVDDEMKEESKAGAAAAAAGVARGYDSDEDDDDDALATGSPRRRRGRSLLKAASEAKAAAALPAAAVVVEEEEEDDDEEDEEEEEEEGEDEEEKDGTVEKATLPVPVKTRQRRSSESRETLRNDGIPVPVAPPPPPAVIEDEGEGEVAASDVAIEVDEGDVEKAEPAAEEAEPVVEEAAEPAAEEAEPAVEEAEPAVEEAEPAVEEPAEELPEKPAEELPEKPAVEEEAEKAVEADGADSASDESKNADASPPSRRPKAISRLGSVRLVRAGSRLDVFLRKSAEERAFKAIRFSNNEAVLEEMQNMDLSASEDEHGWTLLHYSSMLGLSDVTRALLAAGADVNATTEEGAPALQLAAYAKQESVAALLLEAGATIDGEALPFDKLVAKYGDDDPRPPELVRLRIGARERASSSVSDLIDRLEQRIRELESSGAHVKQVRGLRVRLLKIRRASMAGTISPELLRMGTKALEDLEQDVLALDEEEEEEAES